MLHSSRVFPSYRLVAVMKFVDSPELGLSNRAVEQYNKALRLHCRVFKFRGVFMLGQVVPAEFFLFVYKYRALYSQEENRERAKLFRKKRIAKKRVATERVKSLAKVRAKRESDQTESMKSTNLLLSLNHDRLTQLHRRILCGCIHRQRILLCTFSDLDRYMSFNQSW